MKKNIKQLGILSVLLLTMIPLNGFREGEQSLAIPQIDPISAEDEFTTFKVGMFGFADTLDCANSWDSTSNIIIDQICEGLFAYDLNSPEMTITPQLAAGLGSWDSSNTSYTISLRSDVSFHDGAIFNATSVVWNFQRLYNLIDTSKSQFEELYYPLNGQRVINQIVAENEFTVRFDLNYPFAALPALLCFEGSFMLSPESTYFNEELRYQNGDWAYGTGPFMLDSYTDGEQIELSVNENYYLPVGPIKKVKFIPSWDYDELATNLTSGQIHLLTNVMEENLTTLAATPGITLSAPYSNTIVEYIGFNVDNVPEKWRQIYSHAVDYTFYSNSRAPAREIASSFLPPGFQDRLTSELPEFNIALARNMILSDPILGPLATARGLTLTSTDADWKSVSVNNPIETFNYTFNEGSSLRTLIGDEITSSFSLLGVKITIEEVPWSEFLYMIWRMDSSHEHLDLFYLGWGIDYMDPFSMLHILDANYPSNPFGYNDPVYQQMLIDSLSMMDSADRTQLHINMQRYIQNITVPMIPTVYSLGHMAWNDHLVGFTTNPLNKVYLYPCNWTMPIGDSDGDGISDEDETNLYGTDPEDRDSDDDGINDYDEIYLYYTNPLESDTDSDGISDFYEITTYSTDPNHPDTDGDGLSDYEEVITSETDPIDSDSDDDGLTDYEEFRDYNTDPNNWDTDGDQLSDYEEVTIHGTDPLLSNTDGDYLDDWTEIHVTSTDPLDPDSDDDGLLDGEETQPEPEPVPDQNPLEFLPGFALLPFMGMIGIVIALLLVRKKNKAS